MVIDFSSFYEWPRYMDRLLEGAARPGSAGRGPGYPPLDLSEDEHTYYVRAELPGVDLADLDLTLTEKSLVLRGERKAPAGRLLRQERTVGAFQRVVTLNAPVDRDAVSAVMKDGVLSVALPKSAAAKTRKIEIRPA